MNTKKQPVGAKSLGRKGVDDSSEASPWHTLEEPKEHLRLQVVHDSGGPLRIPEVREERPERAGLMLHGDQHGGDTVVMHRRNNCQH